MKKSMLIVMLITALVVLCSCGQQEMDTQHANNDDIITESVIEEITIKENTIDEIVIPEVVTWENVTVQSWG